MEALEGGDVLYAAKKFKVDNIVRITCDCPLVDTLLINKMLKKFNREKLD